MGNFFIIIFVIYCGSNIALFFEWWLMMSEKRFKSTIDEDTMSIMPFLVSDNEEECFYNLEGCVDLLNEQQATINELKAKLKEKQGDGV